MYRLPRQIDNFVIDVKVLIKKRNHRKTVRSFAKVKTHSITKKRKMRCKLTAKIYMSA